MGTEAGRASTRVSSDGTFDVVTIGETMVAFVAEDDQRRFVAVPAGAESNLAVGMASLGCRTQWVSRLGTDPLGGLVEASISGAGVTADVVRDAANPTGVMTIHRTADGRRATYYRSQSAARLLGPVDLHRAGVGRWVHMTGVTAALSASGAGLVDAVVVGREIAGAKVSFDVNHRDALWPDRGTAARTLLHLARAADLVFVGDDEAEVLFGTVDAEPLADLVLRRPGQELVLKRGPGEASLITDQGVVSEPALPVEVVEATGAGDAFAAGFLAATCFGWSGRSRLRLGHLMGSRTVGVLDHVAPPLSDAERAELSPSTLAARWEVLRES